MGAWRSYNTGFSNSPMQILAHCGLYIGIIYIILFCLAVKNAIEIHNLDFFIYVVMFIFLFTIILVSYQYIVVFILILLNDKSFSRSLEYNLIKGD